MSFNFFLKKKGKKKIRATSHRALKVENKNSFGKTLWPFCHLHEGANAGWWMDRWTDWWMDWWMDGWLVPVFPCYDQGPCFLASHTFTSLVCLVGCFYWRKIALQGCIDFCHTTTVYLFRALLLACGSLAQVCAVSQLEVDQRSKANGSKRTRAHPQ